MSPKNHLNFHLKNVFCLFVCCFLTITIKGLNNLTNGHRIRPLLYEISLYFEVWKIPRAATHFYVISEDPWHSHLLPICFKDLTTSLRHPEKCKNPTFHMQGKRHKTGFTRPYTFYTTCRMQQNITMCNTLLLVRYISDTFLNRACSFTNRQIVHVSLESANQLSGF